MCVEGQRFRSGVSVFIGAMTALSSRTVNDILNDPDFNPDLMRKRGAL
jgi:hypothetical protein